MTINVSKSLWKPHVAAEVEALDKLVPGCGWGTYPGHDPSEALAADAMIPKWTLAFGIAIGNKLADLAWARRKQSGLWYQIWRGRIRSMTRPEAGWLPYFNRNNPNPSKSHKNHHHGSFYAAAPALPKPAEPKPAPAREFTEGWVPPLPWVYYEDHAVWDKPSVSVWLIQKALGLTTRDGIDSPELRERVRAWQLNVLKDDPKNCDGILGPKQAKALFGPLVKIVTKKA